MPKREKLPAVILLIDTTSKDETVVGLLVNGRTMVSKQQVRAQALPELVNKLLEDKKLVWKSLTAVAVLTGPGSYTGTRMGVTVANVLSWLQEIPIYSFSDVNFAQALEILQSGKLPRAHKQAFATK